MRKKDNQTPKTYAEKLRILLSTGFWFHINLGKQAAFYAELPQNQLSAHFTHELHMGRGKRGCFHRIIGLTLVQC